jgi:hypothetical protein
MERRQSQGNPRVFEDHRDNLTVDVSNVLVQERASQLRSEDSPCALLWNTFRALQKLDSRLWIPRILLHALGVKKGSPRLRTLLRPSHLSDPQFHWWHRFDLPPSRHDWLRDQATNASLDLHHYPARYLAQKKAEASRLLQEGLPLEERVEVPLLVETPAWMLGVLAVYRGNLRQNTCFDARRDALLRLLDAGTHAAAAADKKFLSLVLYTDPRTYNTETKQLVDQYRGHADVLTARLPHRQDRDVLRQAAQGIGAMRWRDLGGILLDIKDEERMGLFDSTSLDELIKYLARKEVGFNLLRRLK